MIQFNIERAKETEMIDALYAKCSLKGKNVIYKGSSSDGKNFHMPASAFKNGRGRRLITMAYDWFDEDVKDEFVNYAAHDNLPPKTISQNQCKALIRVGTRYEYPELTTYCVNLLRQQMWEEYKNDPTIYTHAKPTEKRMEGLKAERDEYIKYGCKFKTMPFSQDFIPGRAFEKPEWIGLTLIATYDAHDKIAIGEFINYAADRILPPKTTSIDQYKSLTMLGAMCGYSELVTHCVKELTAILEQLELTKVEQSISTIQT